MLLNSDQELIVTYVTVPRIQLGVLTTANTNIAQRYTIESMNGIFTPAENKDSIRTCLTLRVYDLDQAVC